MPGQGPEDARRGTVEEAAQRKLVLYDKGADAHYDVISAFIKSLRGSDPDAALYYLAVMLTGGEDPKFIARRMVIFASEDIGNADPRALEVAVAVSRAVEFVGLPGVPHQSGPRSDLPRLRSQVQRLLRGHRGGARGGARSTGLRRRRCFCGAPATRGPRELGHGVGYEYPHDSGGYIASGTCPKAYATGSSIVPPTKGREPHRAVPRADAALRREATTAPEPESESSFARRPILE